METVQLGFLGVSTNGMCFYYSLQRPYNYTAFGLFLAAKSFSNIAGLSIFLIWCLPQTFWPTFYVFVPSTYTFHLGMICQGVDATGTVFHTMIALNRLMRFYGIKMKTKFASLIHRIVVIITYLTHVRGRFSKNHVCSRFSRADTKVIYNPYIFQWEVLQMDEISKPNGVLQNLIVYYFFFLNIVSAISDVTTLILLHKASIVVRQNYDLWFFLLLFAQHVVYLINSTLFAYLPDNLNLFVSYLLKFGLWKFCYVFDGCTILMLSKTTREILKGMFCCCQKTRIEPLYNMNVIIAD
ncbi:hypothetical protein L596_025177 [Steinernema carpocapsae]|uniref:7TM GPCR serpentine receptor class x (Srx) domain-containing protein n=1 Tax=Steinernema carpocapsae TaxID=34508 RepID=A0A4U5M715_STECR|nr:hypothetical protein L596_025177 [Steinernema carpocapsae]